MTWYNNKWHNLKHCFELIFLAKIKCLWQIKTIRHYFFCNLIDIHTHTQHGLFDNQAGGSGSARSTRLVAMRCALCTSVQALSRVGWCHRCARACAVYLVQERMDEAMTRARARFAAAYTDLLAWLNGSSGGGGGKNFPFHPSRAYHSWLLGRLIWGKDALIGVFTKWKDQTNWISRSNFSLLRQKRRCH